MSKAAVWAVPLLVGVLTALIAAVGGYVVARRRNSGTVRTSEAATLWAESNQMRQELREEVVHLRQECESLRAEVIRLRAEVTRLDTLLSARE